MSIQQLTAAISYRPVRVAWLVAESRVSGVAGFPILLGLAQECCRRWEGRNSILVPFSEGTLSEQSRLLLKHHDPDEVIALDSVAPAVIEEIDELVHLLAFQSKGGEEKTSALDFQAQSVAVLPTDASLKRRDTTFFNRDSPELLLFAFAETCPSEVRQCVTLNFGTYAHVIRQDSTVDFGPAGELWRDLPHRVYVLGSVDDFAAALDELAGDWQRPAVRFVAPMQLAEGRDDVRHRWPSDDRFHVFVGDSFEDAFLFWHQPLCDRSWQLGSQFRFYLPECLAKQPKFRTAMQKWLRRFTNAGNSLHKAPLFISNSLPKASIGQLATELLQNNPFSISSAETEYRTELHIPGDDYEPHSPMFLGTVERASNTELCRVGAPSDAVLVGRPDVVAAGAVSPRWMADIFLEMPPPPELARGKESIWRFPAARSQDLVSRMFRGGCRVQRAGYPSVQLNGMRPMVEIAQPHPYHVFEMLFRGRRYSSLITDLRRCLPERDSTEFSIAVSDKGQRYRAAVDLFGGFAVAAQYLESVLWRNIFRQLASEKPTADATLRQNIISVLRKEIPRSDEPERERAAQRVVEKIQGRAKEVQMTFKQLAKLLSNLRRTPRPFPTEQRIREDTVYSNDSAWPHDCASLRTGLTNLMFRGVVEAGFELSCHRCGSVSWVSLRLAAQHSECPQCEATWNANAEMPWSYRLAPLVRRAFQPSGGGMPVLLAVNRLHMESVGSFLWHPNIEIYRPDYENGERPWRELDIVALIDGKLAIGEVKNAFSDFKEADFTRLREVCEAIRPDVALLVFLEGDYSSNSSFAERFEALASHLMPRTMLEWRKLPSGW